MAKKNKNNNNRQQAEAEEAQQQQQQQEAETTAPITKADVQNLSATNGGESNCPTPSVTPTAPPAKRGIPDSNESSTIMAKQPYTIVPTPHEESAAQKIAGYYKRQQNNQRTEAEARLEEAYEEQLETLTGEERQTVMRAWAQRPSHILMQTAFGNKEKFDRLYIDAEFDGFMFCAGQDFKSGRAAILKAERTLRAAQDVLGNEEANGRAAIRKESREAVSALILDKDAHRRAVMVAEREARRQARQEALPEPPAEDASTAAGGTATHTEGELPTADV